MSNISNSPSLFFFGSITAVTTKASLSSQTPKWYGWHFFVVFLCKSYPGFLHWGLCSLWPSEWRENQPQNIFWFITKTVLHTEDSPSHCLQHLFKKVEICQWDSQHFFSLCIIKKKINITKKHTERKNSTGLHVKRSESLRGSRDNHPWLQVSFENID